MRCRKYLIFHGIYPIRNQIFPRAFFYTVIDTGRNLPEHPKQISRLQSRPLAFVRMCLKAALTAKRLICKKTLAGCDRAVCQPVYPEDTFGGVFVSDFCNFSAFAEKGHDLRVRLCPVANLGYFIRREDGRQFFAHLFWLQKLSN